MGQCISWDRKKSVWALRILSEVLLCSGIVALVAAFTLEVNYSIKIFETRFRKIYARENLSNYIFYILANFEANFNSNHSIAEASLGFYTRFYYVTFFSEPYTTNRFRQC